MPATAWERDDMAGPDIASTATDRAVSVIIPARNCLAYLPAALASVKAQALPNLEAIVIDDGSTDGTLEWLGAKRRRAPWLTVLRGQGEGPNVARNRGIAAARAPFIAFLDADDVWLPGKLRPQLAFHAADPKAAFSFTDYLHVDPTGTTHGTCFEYWPAFHRVVAALAIADAHYQRLERAPVRLLAENVVSTSTVVARRNALQNATGFDATIRSAADWDLWLRLARAGPVGFTAGLGAHHLIRRPGSVSDDAPLRIACMRRIVAAHAPAITPCPGGRSAVRRARAHIVMTEADLARSHEAYAAAACADLEAFCLAPDGRLARAVAADLLRLALQLARPRGLRGRVT
jgi:glycosyltransferase involved in cell wall biosynthesis